MKRYIGAGNRINGSLAALMTRRKVSTAARLPVHNAVLVPALLYGSETWVLQKKKERKMNVVEMRYLRDEMRIKIKREQCPRPCPLGLYRIYPYNSFFFHTAMQREISKVSKYY